MDVVVAHDETVKQGSIVQSIRDIEHALTFRLLDSDVVVFSFRGLIGDNTLKSKYPDFGPAKVDSETIIDFAAEPRGDLNRST